MKRFPDQWWGVEVARGFRACLSCGLVWSGLNANSLHSFILEHGGELARQQIDDWDDGPMRGLPDTALARQVAANVAEVDFLVRSDQPFEVLRRYQQMTGVTRDQAFAVTENWRSLKREEKLAHFGWVDKKPAIDDLADPLT